MVNFICGGCAKKQNKTLEERKEMGKSIQEGLNICKCGRQLKYEKYVLTVIKE